MFSFQHKTYYDKAIYSVKHNTLIYNWQHVSVLVNHLQANT